MPPALWTSWRDRRDGMVVTVTNVRHWGKRFGVLPPGGQGDVDVEVDGVTIDRRRHVPQGVFEEHFELIYDPHTGYDRAA